MLDGPGAVYAACGVAAVAAAYLPRLLNRSPVSMPMVFLAAGVLAFVLIEALPNADPLEYPEFTLHLTELCVVVSLMGAGLALNRPPGWRRWSTTWRLLAVTMPLSMLAVGLLGGWLLGLSAAASVLLAAALAPTDPVLASEVQVGEPNEDPEAADEDEARFALTSEAGLNDGLAFPFVYAAVAISLAGVAPSGWLAEWLVVDVLWRISVGVLVGFVTGKALRAMFFSSRSSHFKLAEQSEGFIALAATFLAYGVAELAEGYGFIAVFICACTIRAAERNHSYHGVLHNYVEQLERLITVVVLFLFGGAVANGLLTDLRWPEVVVALAFLLVIRPVTGLLALSRGGTGPRERLAIAFFGVRGVGSLFYVAYALQEGDFGDPAGIWRVVGIVVVGSVLIHGISATPVMSHLDRSRQNKAERCDEDPASPASIPV
ncbi:MAG: cation:proton antiporter [Nocardioidaceae bacterium]|nr:cation:proton antiporter [Nocardioidaceae bacterium]